MVASPVQVYPLNVDRTAVRHHDTDGDRRGDGACGESVERAARPTELLMATDWDVESALPTKFAVMPIGVDSLDLVHLAPRDACDGVLDLCCGSGVQATQLRAAGCCRGRRRGGRVANGQSWAGRVAHHPTMHGML